MCSSSFLCHMRLNMLEVICPAFCVLVGLGGSLADHWVAIKKSLSNLHKGMSHKS